MPCADKIHIKILSLCVRDPTRQVLEEMEMLHAFTAVLHVPNLNKPEHLLSVLEESDVFTKQEVATIARNIEGRRYVLCSRRWKKLILPGIRRYQKDTRWA